MKVYRVSMYLCVSKSPSRMHERSESIQFEFDDEGKFYAACDAEGVVKGVGKSVAGALKEARKG